MIKRKKSMAGAALAMLLLAAGCSSNADTTAGDKGEKKQDPYVIGVTQIVEHPSLDEAYKGFQAALKDKGLNVEYDVQIAQGDMNNNQTIAQNFAGDGVDLIFANSTPSALGALNATKDIPIVFTSVTDPIGAGLVKSFEKPGANITGTTDTHPDAIPNTIKFIDKYEEGTKVGMIFNSGEQNSVAQINMVKEAVKGTDLKVVEAPVSTSAEVKQAAESLVGNADVIYIITDNTVVSALESVVKVASDEDIPLYVGELDSVKRGGFAAYGFNYYDIGYQTGEMAASILTGDKKPSDISVQYPNKLKLLINKKAAEDMGVKLLPDWDKEAEYSE